MNEMPEDTAMPKSEEPKEDNKYTRMAVMASICIGVVFFLGLIIFSATMADDIYTGNITDIYKPPHNGPGGKVINFTIGPNRENLPDYSSIYIPNELDNLSATDIHGYLEWQINENYTGNDSNYTEGNQT